MGEIPAANYWIRPALQNNQKSVLTLHKQSTQQQRQRGKKRGLSWHTYLSFAWHTHLKIAWHTHLNIPWHTLKHCLTYSLKHCLTYSLKLCPGSWSPIIQGQEQSLLFLFQLSLKNLCGAHSMGSRLTLLTVTTPSTSRVRDHSKGSGSWCQVHKWPPPMGRNGRC